MQPADINLAGCVYQIGTRIRSQAFVEKHTPVAALLAADEEYGVVLQGEAADVGHTVCHLSADGVVIRKGGLRADVLLDVIDYLAELVERHCRLGVEADVAVEVQLLGILCRLDNDGRFLRLSHQADYLSMAVLPEDDNLLGPFPTSP